MRSLLGFAAVVVVALPAAGYAQKAEIIKATYMVTGLH